MCQLGLQQIRSDRIGWIPLKDPILPSGRMNNIQKSLKNIFLPKLLPPYSIEKPQRKHNLYPDQPYYFRAAPLFESTQQVGQWMIHREPFVTLDAEEEEYCMAPPVVNLGGPGILIVAWEDVEEAYFFELQMRENRGGMAWQTIGDEVHGTEVKKKNLTSPHGYQFRVRPITETEEPWSPPSTQVVAPEMKDNMQHNRDARRANASRRPGKRPPKMKKPPSAKTQQNHVKRSHKDPNAMEAPWIQNAGMANAVLVCWQGVNGATGYELQMRENEGSSPWVTVAANLSGTEVRKKNLTNPTGYTFRVRPNGLGYVLPFSLPSSIAIAT